MGLPYAWADGAALTWCECLQASLTGPLHSMGQHRRFAKSCPTDFGKGFCAIHLYCWTMPELQRWHKEAVGQIAGWLKGRISDHGVWYLRRDMLQVLPIEQQNNLFFQSKTNLFCNCNTCYFLDVHGAIRLGQDMCIRDCFSQASLKPKTYLCIDQAMTLSNI